MTTLAYPPSALVSDIARGGLGAALCLLVLVAVRPVWWLQVVLAVLALLFAVFSIRALARVRQRLLVQDDALVEVSSSRQWQWDELESLRLRYFSTRRDQRQGWMELTLKFSASQVSVDSRMSGFDVLVARALSVARSKSLLLDASTLRNMEHLGFDDVTERAMTDA